MGLNSRQGGGGDLPSLDLAFALDKTLTARKGPIPTFTRVQATSTGSTYIGADKLIKYAAANEPRFDHDPVTGICRGLLIEDTRTNLVFPSETLTTQTRTVTAVAHTLSFYGTGTIVLSGVHSATVVGTGDFPSRTTLTFTPTAGSLTLTVAGTVQFAQLEAGAFPLSYIPTTSGTAARSADVCSIIGTDFSSFYNQSEGTLFSSASISNLIGINRGIAQIDDGSNLHIIRHYYDTNGFKVQVKANDATSIFLSITGVADVAQKLAISQQGTLFNAVANGGTVSTITRTSPVGLNALRIGNLTGGAFYLNGHIARIQYFRKRLSNAKLQTLTAP